MIFKRLNNTFLIAIYLSLSMCALAQTDGDIIIEMQGEPVKKYHSTSLSIWDKNTSQLIKALRGKTREQALYAIENVSSKDRKTNTAKASYAIVEYIQENNFRKLLFRGKDPQTFITAATTVEDILAINKKYGINMGLSQKAFEQTYPNKYTLEQIKNLPANTVLYSLSYTDINTPQAQTIWLLFELKQLIQTFYTEAEKEAYIQSLAIPNATPPVSSKKEISAKSKKWKALVSGGTTWEQIYLPRVVPPKPKNTSSDEQSTNK